MYTLCTSKSPNTDTHTYIVTIIILCEHIAIHTHTYIQSVYTLVWDVYIYICTYIFCSVHRDVDDNNNTRVGLTLRRICNSFVFLLL